MMKILREFLFVGLVALMIFGGLTQYQDADLVTKIAEGPTEIVLPEPQAQSQSQGQSQQEVVLTTLDGKQVESVVDVLPEGTEVAFIVFFTSDCPYCGILLEAMEIQKVIPVVGATFMEDDLEAIKEKVAELGITFPVVHGHPWGMTQSLPSFEGVPYTMILANRPDGWMLMWTATGIPSLADYPTHEEQVGYLVEQFEGLAEEAVKVFREAQIEENE